LDGFPDTDDLRAALLEKGHTPEELKPLPEDEFQKIASQLGISAEAEVNLYDTEFEALFANHFVFPRASFDGATFSDYATFSSATFSRIVGFNSATFSGLPDPTQALTVVHGIERSILEFLIGVDLPHSLAPRLADGINICARR